MTVGFTQMSGISVQLCTESHKVEDLTGQREAGSL
jgi:hypothetical protein